MRLSCIAILAKIKIVARSASVTGSFNFRAGTAITSSCMRVAFGECYALRTRRLDEEEIMREIMDIASVASFA